MAPTRAGSNPSGAACALRLSAWHVSVLVQFARSYFFPSVGIDPQRLSAGPATGLASCTESQASTTQNTVSLGAFKAIRRRLDAGEKYPSFSLASMAKHFERLYVILVLVFMSSAFYGLSTAPIRRNRASGRNRWPTRTPDIRLSAGRYTYTSTLAQFLARTH